MGLVFRNSLFTLSSDLYSSSFSEFFWNTDSWDGLGNSLLILTNVIVELKSIWDLFFWWIFLYQQILPKLSHIIKNDLETFFFYFEIFFSEFQELWDLVLWIHCFHIFLFENFCSDGYRWVCLALLAQLFFPHYWRACI